MTERTSWSAHGGLMTFTMPSGASAQLEARAVEVPNTLCTLADSLARLSARERTFLTSLVEQHVLRAAAEEKKKGK